MQNYKFLFSILFFSMNLCSETINYLQIDDDYKISIFASDIESPRQLAEGTDGTIYVGSRGSGRIYAIKDTDNNFSVIKVALSSLGKLVIIKSKSTNTPYYIWLLIY